jgi:hypothetical protein
MKRGNVMWSGFTRINTLVSAILVELRVIVVEHARAVLEGVLSMKRGNVMWNGFTRINTLVSAILMELWVIVVEQASSFLEAVLTPIRGSVVFDSNLVSMILLPPRAKLWVVDVKDAGAVLEVVFSIDETPKRGSVVRSDITGSKTTCGPIRLDFFLVWVVDASAVLKGLVSNQTKEKWPETTASTGEQCCSISSSATR